MELYFSPGACSLASHIALIEAGIPHTTRKVDLKSHTVEGKDFYEVNPKGAVPTLRLDDQQVLTENVAVLQFIADKKPQAHLAPEASEFARYRLQEWLSYISAEVHKSFHPYFDPSSTAEAKAKAEKALKQKLGLAEEALGKTRYLNGNEVSVADFYLYVMLTWINKFEVKLTARKNLDRFFQEMEARPSVQQAKAAEKH